MATDLQERPEVDGGSDSLNPAESFYDKQFAGLTSPEHQAIDGERGNLREAERSAADGGLTAGAVGKSALKGMEDKLGAGFTGGAAMAAAAPTTGAAGIALKVGTKLLGSQRRRNATVGGGIGGAIVVAIIFFVMLSSGPAQALQFANYLDEAHFSDQHDAGNNRNNKFLLYALLGKPGKGRLGAVKNIRADRIEKKLNNQGLKSVYNSTGRLIGYQVTDKDKAKGFVNEMDRQGLKPTPIGDTDIARDINGNSSIKPADGDILNVGDDKFKNRRAVTRAAVKSIGMNRLSSFAASRIMGKRAGINWHILNNEKFKRLYDANRDDKAREKAYREERAKELANGSKTGTSERRTTQKVDEKGAPIPGTEFDDIAADSANDVNSAGSVDPTTEEGRAEAKKITDKLFTKFAGGAAALVGVVCGARDLSDQVEELEYKNNILVMIRMGMEIIVLGDQIKSGEDINARELGMALDPLYDEETKTSVFDAPSVQAGMGKQPTGKDIDDDAKPSKIGEKPALFKAIDAIPGVGGVCKVYNGVGNLPIIKQVGGAISAVTNALTGGAAEKFIAGAVKWMANDVVNKFAAGSERGSYSDYGALLAANDQAIATGGRQLSSGEVAQLTQIQNEEKMKEIASMSTFEKYFDVNNRYSLAGMAIVKMPVVQTDNVASIMTGISGIIQKTFASAFSLSLFKSALAAPPTSYDYGVPIYGFSEDEQNNPAYENPYENAEIVETMLDYKDTPSGRKAGLNETFGNECFGITVEGVTAILRYGDPVNYKKIPPKCQDAQGTHFTKEELTRYRFYISDMITANAISCYEGNDATACAQIGFNEQGGAGYTEGNVAITQDGFAFPLKTSKAIIQNEKPAPWCYKSQSSCHHDYNAADIHAPTGTIVIAARGGTVTKVDDFDSSDTGSRVQIKGDDGNLYYYTHMGDGTIKVAKGQVVSAGDELGRVGTSNDAFGTDPHLHIDILPSTYSARMSCAGADCSGIPFIDPQPALVAAFNKLP